MATGVLTGTATIVILYYLYKFGSTFSVINEWDFLVFYINGKASAGGFTLYNSESLTKVLASIHLPFTVSKGFYSQAILTGVIYPPTTMLMVAPIGYLDLNAANIVWRLFVYSFLIIDIILMNRIFKIHDSNWIQVIIILVLTLIIPGSISTLYYTQTNFILLFFILLIYKEPDNWKAGVFVALAIIVKPIAVVWGLYFLANKKWKPIFSFAISGLIIVLSTILLFGLDNFLAFFTSPPTSRIPMASFIEINNQSMNAVFMRMSILLGMNSIESYMNWLVLFFTVILVSITCVASYKIATYSKMASFLIFIPLSQIIFPGSLTHYVVQLLPIFFALIVIKNKTTFALFIVILLVLIFSTFSANLILLLFFIISAFVQADIFSQLEINSKSKKINQNQYSVE